MKVFKFRSLAANSVGFVKNIIEDGKFYFSHFSELNDPMEGIYYALLHDDEDRNIIEEIFQEKSHFRLCSFSGEEGFQNPAMWGYYANGFKGVAFEIDIPDKAVGKELRKVRYVNSNPTIKIRDRKCAKRQAKSILTTKLSKWSHENEYRFLLNDSSYRSHNVGIIAAAYFGDPYGDADNRDRIRGYNPKLSEYVDLRNEISGFAKNRGIPCFGVRVAGNCVVKGKIL
jgi:hypothetical protein